jgi:hypothetical protein
VRPVRQIVYLAPPSRPAIRFGLLLRTASGRVHPLAAYLGWLYDAGFKPPERHRLVGQVQAVLLVARKPADG